MQSVFFDKVNTM